MLKKIMKLFKGGEAEEKAPEKNNETMESEKDSGINETSSTVQNSELTEKSSSEDNEGVLDNAVSSCSDEFESVDAGGGAEFKVHETVLSNTTSIVEADAASDKGLEFQEKISQKSWFSRLAERLVKTKNNFSRKLGELFGDRMAITPEVIERLEEILIEADIGVKTTQKIIQKLDEKLETIKIQSMDDLKNVLKDIMTELVSHGDTKLNLDNKLSVMLVIGVNGVGKTTTIGKIASNLTAQGKKAMIVAADTFRAGAIEQAEIWAKRVGIPVVKAQPNSDPAAVVYDAIQAAKARSTDVLIVDTAGRLHTKFNLMEELKKINKILAREIPGAPHEVLQVLDGAMGQNALFQAKTFNEAIGVTGIAITKLDGTAKGGIVISICDELKIPIKLIGIGEGIDDLKEFNGADFIKAIFE
ncbi:MAG: signal recognition particle-docking protein FtsY [Candidatus Wallbacteria bacterium]